MIDVFKINLKRGRERERARTPACNLKEEKEEDMDVVRKEWRSQEVKGKIEADDWLIERTKKTLGVLATGWTNRSSCAKPPWGLQDNLMYTWAHKHTLPATSFMCQKLLKPQKGCTKVKCIGLNKEEEDIMKQKIAPDVTHADNVTISNSHYLWTSSVLFSWDILLDVKSNEVNVMVLQNVSALEKLCSGK